MPITEEEHLELFLPYSQNKKVDLVCHQTCFKGTHYRLQELQVDYNKLATELQRDQKKNKPTTTKKIIFKKIQRQKDTNNIPHCSRKPRKNKSKSQATLCTKSFNYSRSGAALLTSSHQHLFHLS